VGSPDPPPPFTVERVFTEIDWKSPIFLIAEPGTDQLLVVQQDGEQDRPSQVVRVQDDPAAATTETLLEMEGRLIYSVEFHPRYVENGWLYVFSNGARNDSERVNRVSRFTVGRDPPYACDAASEQTIIEWPSAGHDGGGLVFGNDGMLYISSGDGTSDSDTLVSGQDVSNLLGSVLRIDVFAEKHPHEGQAYSIPPDNPLLGVPNARGELWAYGLRNPWRLCVDRETGQIWTGNNGQDLWETAHLVRRGENYGWSVYEGSHPFYLHRPRGPTPIVLPTIEHHHSEFLSLTGGVVYRGERHAELDGVYVYGDYTTGRIWGARHDGERLTWHRELADTTLAIAAFAVSHHGELLVVDHAGGIYRLVAAPPEENREPFPLRLSDTGLFLSVKDHQVQPGVVAYSVNAPGWNDGAAAHRYFAIPGEEQIDYATSGSWNFPDGTVLMQTLSIGPLLPNGRTRIETRLFVRQSGQWAGYSFRWSEDQTDATLVGPQAAEIEVDWPDPDAPGKTVRRKWQIPSRAQCLTCHSRAASFVLGLSEAQLNREHDYGGVTDHQLRTLAHVGMFQGGPAKSHAELEKLADPYETAGDLDARARAYLHVNCSVCHVGAGGGNAKMELTVTTSRDRMSLIDARPQHDTFGIDNAMLVAPGDADRSILYHRIARRGRGQMPPLVTSVVDEAAVTLFRDWIAAMEPQRKFVREWTLEDLLPHVDAVGPSRSLEAGRAAFRDAGCSECHRVGEDGGSVGPDLTGVAGRLGMRDLVTSILSPSEKIAPEYANTVLVTATGRSVVGRIEREDENVVVLRPDASSEPVVLARPDIEKRSLSPISNMPTGTLNTFELEQILDLLAYLVADGRLTEK
jgi:uncharacterized repeat protein (TIGR03806 family)